MDTPCVPSSFFVRGCARWWTYTTQEKKETATREKDGQRARRDNSKICAGSYARLGFSPVLSEERWICRRTIRPTLCITQSIKTWYHVGVIPHARHPRLGPLCGQRGGHSPPRRLVSHRRGVDGRSRRRRSATAAGAAAPGRRDDPDRGPRPVEHRGA